MKITLIRHGKTLANEQRLYCGATDLPLSEAGKKAILTEQRIYPNAQDYYTSGMKRTEETLQLLYGETCPHRRETGLRELDFGEFEMHSYDELKDREDYQAWICGDNFRNVCPGGESGEQMQRRVLAAYREIERRGRDAVIVTHGGVIAELMAALFPQEEKNRYEWQPASAEGYEITYAETLRYRCVPFEK